ncbi:MAG TPA: alpha/beta fold hydrolase [Vineibacter sp.]|nr:alpha/beta fold hydrolase [Vineibacter sp.]
MTSLAYVESRLFTLRDVALDLGGALPECRVAYETYGKLNAAGDNAVLATHGYTSSAHVAGRYAAGKAAPGVAEDQLGWWDALIGPGKAIDTDRYFVVGANALGSAHGSSGPNTADPKTGKPYGPTFPEVTLRDSVRAQKALLDHLGVKRLHAVVGPSMGGFQAFQWAVTYPDFMRGIVPTVTAPRMRGGLEPIETLISRLATDPNWNGGWYYDKGGIKTVLEQIRYDTLINYGQRELLAASIPDPAAREAAIRATARAWAETYDGHSLVVLRKAISRFDITADYGKIKAKVLYVIAPNDKLFPGAVGPGYAADLRAAGIDITYVELVTDKGHLASHADAAQWAPMLRAFMDRLAG